MHPRIPRGEFVIVNDRRRRPGIRPERFVVLRSRGRAPIGAASLSGQLFQYFFPQPLRLAEKFLILHE
jgi:hypothetical protein